MKERFEAFIIFVVIILFGSISYAVIKTASDISKEIEERTEQHHLPSKCVQYFNDGTDQWKECMGVGYQ